MAISVSWGVSFQARNMLRVASISCLPAGFTVATHFPFGCRYIRVLEPGTTSSLRLDAQLLEGILERAHLLSVSRR